MWNYWWKSRWARPKVKSRRSTTESLFSSYSSYSGHNLVIILFCLIQLMHNLFLVHAGDCLSNRSDLGENDFILECTEDGNYKPIQCDNKTGYCFCVDKSTGRPNSDTTTRNRSPNCNESTQPSGPSNIQSSSASTSSFRNSQSSSSPQSSAYSQSRKPEHSRDGRNKKSGTKNRRCQTGKRLSFLGQLLAVIKQSRGFRRSNGDSGAGGNIRYPFGIPLGIRPTIGSTTQHHNSVDYDDEELIVKKFNDFDTNSDQNLSQSELNELIRSIRSILMPTLDGCVNSFFDFCDADQNGEIGRDEFVNCLNLRNTQKLNAAYAKRKKEMRANGGGRGGGGGKVRDQASITNRPTAFGSNVGISSWDTQYQRSQIRPVSTPKSPESEEFGQSKTDPSTSSSLNQFRNVDPSLALFLSANSITLNEDGARSVGAASGTGSGGMSLLSGSSSSQNGKNESRLDCLVTRSNAIESARINPNGPVFIPECTKEGYYASVQCHQLHCWCVSRVSGQTIKHLVSNSTETMRACDQIRKGCDHRRRTKFHARLRQLLRHSKLSCNSVFDHIDRDRNQQVDHSEWKRFQQRLLSKSQSNRNSSSQRFNSRLQKCFRTEINYCDQNGDERLSQQEWVQCCNDNVTITSNGMGGAGATSGSSSSGGGGATSSAVFHHQATADAYNQKKNRQRTGPNPFKTILKPE